MNRLAPVTIAIASMLLRGGDDKPVVEEQTGVANDSQSSEIPETFSEALDALDKMATADEKEAYRNDESHMGLVHRRVGMRLRNNWGLWGVSKLKDYFSKRGIAHADWISSVIFTAWIEHLKTGQFDESRVIAEYAKVEKDSRERLKILH